MKSVLDILIDRACGVPPEGEMLDAKAQLSRLVAEAARRGAEYALAFVGAEKHGDAAGAMHSVADFVVFDMIESPDALPPAAPRRANAKGGGR